MARVKQQHPVEKTMSYKKFSTESYSPFGLKFDGDGFIFKADSSSDSIVGANPADLLGGGAPREPLRRQHSSDSCAPVRALQRGLPPQILSAMSSPATRWPSSFQWPLPASAPAPWRYA